MWVSKNFIFGFASALLGEAGIDDEVIENDLESLIYEAGERNWDEDEDGDGYLIPSDYY